jgi:hypothetical protein
VKKDIVFIYAVLLVLFGSFVGQNQKVYRYLFDNANFTENHCINKDNPEKKCNGACQLNANENSDEPSAPTQPDYRPIDVFLDELTQFFLGMNFVVRKPADFTSLFALLKKKDKILVPPPNVVV